MKSLSDYSNPFDAVRDFERELQNFTGAPYAIVTDCCTHAIEIVLRLQRPEKLFFPGRTYLSVVMLMHKIGIDYELTDQSWFTDQRYKFQGSNIWDCARYFEPGMYQSGEIQCLSFNRGKPLAIGKGGAILTDNTEVAARANRMRYDGRDIFQYKNWVEQRYFEIGFHYYLRPEECVNGLNLLNEGKFIKQIDKYYDYPDCRNITIS